MKKLLIVLMALMLALSLSLVSCGKKDKGDEPDTSESESIEEPQEKPQEEAPKVEKQCTFSLKLDNGESLSGVKLTLKSGATEYTLESGADGTVSTKLVLGKYSISYDYDTLPSGCMPDSFSVDITANTSEVLLTVIDNNPNGTLAKPFFIMEDVTPLTIDAGREVYYNCRGSMRYLIIESDGVVVTYEGAEYTAEDGKIVVLISPELDESARFSIKNITDEALEISICMEAPKGSMENPIAMEGNSAQASVPAEGAVYYKYVADKNGVLVVSSENEKNDIRLSNQSTSVVTSNTEGASSTSIDVSAGDEILIEVGSTDDKNAVVIEFVVSCQ